MGRIVDLCGEIAANADEGPDGLVLPPDAWAKLRTDWSDEDIEDALSFVHDSLLQGELVEAADSLSARLVEVLGAFGEENAFTRLVEGGGKIDLEVTGQLVRRLNRLEEILESFREEKGPDRRGLDALQRRLMDQGIEKEMEGEGEES
jgi:uncharacterized protein with von Willebrand factor type A (vWA) domain